MFDEVRFKCPNCDETIEVQSKAGSCTMNTYSADSVPVEIARSLNYLEIQCGHCDREYVVVTPNIQTRVAVILREK